MKAAVCTYPIERFEGFDAYAEKLSAWVREAADGGAELLVFPEYGAMELAGWTKDASVRGQMAAASGLMPRMWDHLSALAKERNVHILAPSGPFETEAGFVNRAMMIAPNGRRAAADKQILTLWEREDMGMIPGAPLCVYDTALGKIGVLICYDSEFPLLARALVEAGAEMLLVPSATDTLAGYHRVRTAGLARALEGQMPVLHSPTHGAAPWCEILDENTGISGVYLPMDHGMPADGIAASGAPDTPGLRLVDIDLGAVLSLRKTGGVRGLSHWAEQPGGGAGALPALTVQSLL